ncbi:MAG: tetratricopeptide repeat protein, partial [Pseudomonadota bacterium]
RPRFPDPKTSNHHRNRPSFRSGSSGPILRRRTGHPFYREELAGWSLVLDLLDFELEQAKDAQQRAGLLVLKGRILEDELFEEEAAIAALEEVLKIRPDDESTRETLGYMRQVRENWERIVEKYVEEAQAATDKGLSTSLFLAAAEVVWRNDPESSRLEELLRRSLESDSTNRKASLLLERLLRAQSRTQELIEILEKRSREKQDFETFVEIGLLYWHGLDDLDKAEEYFRRIRKRRPTHREMLDFYCEYYRVKKEPAKIISLLESAQRTETDSKGKLVLSRRIAEVAEAEAANLDKAIDIWKGIQRKDPYADDAKKALARLYRQTTPPKWNALRELLKEQIEALGEDDVEEKIQLLTEVVEIYRDHLKLPVMVINTYNAILAVKPDHWTTIDALIELYEEMQRWNDLIGLLEHKCSIQTESEEQIELLRRIASVWLEKVGNQVQAVAPLKRILKVAPLDEHSINLLQEIYERRRNWRGLLELWGQEADHREASERRKLYQRMASLAVERLGDKAEAIKVWKYVLDDEPDNEEALAELAKLYEAEGEWLPLTGVLRKQREACEDPEEVVILLERLGDLYLSEIREVDKAMGVWREVLELNPEHPKALAVLGHLLVQQKRWEELEEFFTRRGEYFELAEALTAAADRSSETKTKTRLYSRVAEICREELNDSARAIKAYERVMAVDPTDLGTARALVPLYVAAGTWDRLLPIYETLLEFVEEKDEQLSLLVKIRELCEVNLGSKRLAFDWCTRAYAISPEDEELVSDLERLAEEANAWDELVKVYADRVVEMEDLYTKLQLLRHLGDICVNQLRRPEEAERFHRQILDIVPEDEKSLVSLQQIYDSGQRWSELVEIRRKQFSTYEEKSKKIAALFDIAMLCEERLGDLPAAVRSYVNVLEYDSSNRRVLDSLVRLYQVLGEWEELAGVLKQKLELTTKDEERVEFLRQLGDLQEGRLGQRVEAISTYETALETDPLHAASAIALERLFANEDSNRVRIAGLLASHFERKEDWPNLASMLEVQLGAEEDESERISFLKRLLHLFDEKLTDPNAAYESSLNILSLDPADAGNRKQLAKLAERLQRQEELATALESALRLLSEGQNELELALNWELARIQDEHLGRPEEAKPQLRRVLELDSKHAEAFSLLARILRESGEWVELRALLESGLDREQEQARQMDLLLQICALNEDVLADRDAAISSYERLLELEPEHRVSVRALERHYEASGRWESLVGLLGRQLEFAQDETERNDLKVRQARIQAERMEDPNAAIELIDEVLLADTNCDSAINLLEELMQKEKTHQLRIAEIMERVYEKRRQWSKLVDVLLFRRSLTNDRSEVVELLMRAGELLEYRIDDLQAAYCNFHDALVLDPGLAKARDAIQRLSQMRGEWADAAATWEAAIDAAMADQSVYRDDLVLQAQLLTQLAQVQEEGIGQIDQSQQTYERLLELDRSNVQIAGPAVDALLRLYEGSSQWTKLVGVLRQKTEWAEGNEERQRWLTKIGRIYEDILGQAQEAIGAYEEILEEAPGSTDAVDALERLYVGQERWRDLADLFRRKVDLAETADDRRFFWIRIAGLCEQKLLSDEGAVSAYLAVLDESPDDLETLRGLARLYRKSGRWSDLLEMLERQLSVVEGGQRVEVLYEAAVVQHRELGEIGAAIHRYRQIVEADPSHEKTRQLLELLLQGKCHEDWPVHEDRADAPTEETEHKLAVAEILAPMYLEEGRWEKVVEVHELQVEGAVPAERVRLLCAVGRLLEEKLGDDVGAFGAYKRAMLSAAAEPSLLEVLEELERLAGQLGRWAEFAEVIERTATEVLEERAQKALYLSLAEVCREQLADWDRAIQSYRKILELDADNEKALQGLQTLYEAEEQWELLVEVLHRRAELVSEIETKTNLLLFSGALCRDELERTEDSIADYEGVIELDRSNREALEALVFLYEGVGNWSGLAASLQRLVEISEDVYEQVSLGFRLGKVCADHLSEHSRAVEAYRQVLKLNQVHEGAASALGIYLDDPDLRFDVAQILEPIYVGRQAWSRLVRIYEIRLEAAESAEDRLAFATRIAQLCEEQLENLESAFSWYSKVFLECPADTTIRDQLMRLSGILESWEALTKVFSECLDGGTADAVTRRELALFLGNVYDEHLYKWKPAKECFERVLIDDPNDEEAFALLEGVLTRHEQWEDLRSLYENRISVTVDPDLRRDLMFRVCRVVEEGMDNLPEAIVAYNSVLDELGNDSEAVAALERLYKETERWEDLCALLNSQFEYDEDADSVTARKFRLGTIYETKLHDLTIAIDHYEEVLGRASEHVEAIAALERLVLDRDQRFRITQILEPIYKEQDEWAKLVVIYDAQLEFIDDKEHRVQLRCQIASLHETRDGSLRGLRLAFRAICQGFEEDPGNDFLLGEVKRLGEKLDSWPSVVSLLQKAAEDSYDYDLSARLHSEVAKLQEQRLADPEAAAGSWRKALAAKDGDLSAINALVRLFEQLTRYQELVEILSNKAEFTMDVGEQIEIHERIAELQEDQLHESGKSIERWRHILTLEEGHRAALDALERLYRSASNWMDLIWVLRRKIELENDPQQRRVYYLALAEIYENEVGDNFEAIGAYKEVFEEFSNDVESLDALDRLYSKEGLWSDLLEVIDLKLLQETDPLAINELRFRAGTVLADEIGDVETALAHFEDVVSADNQHQGARNTLETLLAGDAFQERAAEVLQNLYEVTGELPSLVRVLEKQLAKVDPAAKPDLLMRIARLKEEGLEDPRGAFETYVKALAEDPVDSMIRDNLDRLAFALDAVPELVGIYEGQVDSVYDVENNRALHLKIARMAEDMLKQVERAEKHYRAALDCGGDALEALVALDRVLEQEQKWDDLLEVLEQEAQVVSDPNVQAGFYFRIGEIRVREKEDLDGAFAAFKEALERDEAHGGALFGMEKMLGCEGLRGAALDVMEPLFERSDNWSKVIELLEVRRSTIGDPGDRAEVQLRIARIWEEKLNEPQKALDALALAIGGDPENTQIIDRAEKLAKELDRYSQLVSVGEEVLAGEISGHAAEILGLRVANWCLEKLNDVERAENRYKKVLEVSPECVSALESLERIYRSGNDSALAGILWQRAEGEYDVERKKELLSEVAQLRQDILADPEGAIEAWRLILEADESDARAMEALVLLFERKNAWEDYLDIIDRQTRFVDDEVQRIRLKHIAAQVVHLHLEQPSRAIDLYSEILDSVPDDEEALIALEELHRAQEDWESVEEVLLRQVDGPQKVQICFRLAQLATDCLNKPDEAIGFYQQILIQEPDNIEAAAKLEELLKKEERWHDLI